MRLFLHRWNYKCIDLKGSLQSAYTGGQFNLQEFYLYKDASGADFYVDAVYIGKTRTTVDENGTLLNIKH